MSMTVREISRWTTQSHPAPTLFLKSGDAVDLDLHERLAVSVALEIAALGLVLHNLDLLRAADERHGPRDLGAFDQGRSDGRVHSIIDEEDLVEGDGVTLLDRIGELLDGDGVAFGDDILLPASLDYGHFHK